MICDHQKGVPLALLPDRNPETVALWLKRFPHIQIVTRDGFTAFRQAISKANPAIEQVYDRWHFIRNAKKQVTNYIATLLPATITWSSPHKMNTETLAVSFTRSEKEVFARQTQKRKLIQQVKNAYKEGQTIAQLARTFQLDRRTVKKYIHLHTWSPSRQVRRKAIDEYVTQALEWEQEGHSAMAIYRHLQRLGYDAVKRLVREEKRKRNATTLQTFSVSRRKIVTLLWKPQQEYLEEEHELLRHCISLAPPLQTFKSRVQQLRDALNDSTAKLFSKWVQDQLSNTTSPFYRYAQRIRSDLQAIQQSFFSPYSNGRLEGQINRLKTIKRMMYGRAGLKLLEKRILYRM